MESFNNLNNEFIKSIDSTAINNYPLEKSLKNTLKTIVKSSDFIHIGTNTIYNKKMVIDISRSYDNLAQMFIKVVLSTGNVASTVQPGLGFKIFKSIKLMTKKGTTLQYLTPEYQLMRCDEMNGTPLFDYIENAITENVNFVDGDVTVFVPLFLFFSDRSNLYLSTRHLEQLQLELITNDNYSLFGLTVDITSITCELCSLYYDTNTSNTFLDEILTKKVPKNIRGSYSCFEEDAQIIANGATSLSYILRCPYPTFAIHFTALAANSQKAQIKNVKLRFGNRTFVDIDYRINFQLSGKPKGFISDGTFSYYFSKEKDRNVDSGLITFSKEMSPTYVEIEFLSAIPDSTYTLKTFCEYRTNFEVSELGEISISNTVKKNEGQNSMNTVQAPADLTE